MQYLQKLLADQGAQPPLEMEYRRTGGDVREWVPDWSIEHRRVIQPPPAPKPPPVKPPPVKPPVKPPGDDGRPKPKPPKPPAPPPAPPPNMSGLPASLSGVNPVITPMFRHLFSNQDVAKYGIKQPQHMTDVQMTDKGLSINTGEVKKWWLPNQPIVWGKAKTPDGK